MHGLKSIPAHARTCTAKPIGLSDNTRETLRTMAFLVIMRGCRVDFCRVLGQSSYFLAIMHHMNFAS